jgi:hypothetical protein
VEAFVFLGSYFQASNYGGALFVLLEVAAVSAGMAVGASVGWIAIGHFQAYGHWISIGRYQSYLKEPKARHSH